MKNDCYLLILNLVKTSKIKYNNYLRGNVAKKIIRKAIEKEQFHEIKYFWDNIEKIAGKFDCLNVHFKKRLKKISPFFYPGNQ